MFFLPFACHVVGSPSLSEGRMMDSGGAGGRSIRPPSTGFAHFLPARGSRPAACSGKLQRQTRPPPPGKAGLADKVKKYQTQTDTRQCLGCLTQRLMLLTTLSSGDAPIRWRHRGAHVRKNNTQPLRSLLCFRRQPNRSPCLHVHPQTFCR
ncbi:hypothetical protein F5X68DRAFT_48303 [Plectosphaerella plurivora]|uniref:Uncharacterized protein n=1 Tax=Plectosphaerella plurivora TaxID=936078 RepID=A0A9P9AE80_9PEZI|nr:hypothetical protein F5X68DRAFT_48303 [Plectosphaerella plurivora]